MREREDANRTREAWHRDEVEGVVANTPKLPRNGAVGFIDWLDDLGCRHLVHTPPGSRAMAERK